MEYRGVGEYEYLVRAPEADLSVATVCNAYGGTWDLGPKVAALFAAHADSTACGLLVTGRQVATGELVGPPLRRTVTRQPSAATLRAYAGTYVGTDVGDAVDATLRVRVDDDRLTITARGLPPTELQPGTAADAFRFASYGARFQRDAAGRVTHLTLDATRVKDMRYTRRPEPWQSDRAPRESPGGAPVDGSSVPDDPRRTVPVQRYEVSGSPTARAPIPSVIRKGVVPPDVPARVPVQRAAAP
ncbi:MAG: hypothetical protein ACXW0Z_02610 [Gemmatirosa sp.]